MGNLIDYLKWKGDLSFEAMPFNELDAAVFSALAYLDFSPAIKQDDSLTFIDAVTKLKAVAKPRFLALDAPLKEELYNQFLDTVISSNRYKNLILHNYVDIHDEKEITQFSALSFTLKKGIEVIAYRGTDETLVGWKEDCMLSFIEAPCQRRALSYLIDAISNSKKVYVTGHSKGSNLALYASLNLQKHELDKVTGIYLLDGPGLYSDVFKDISLELIDNKVHTFQPEYDVVAKIFENKFSSTTILKSDEKGIMCHGLLSWRVEDGKFVTCLENDPNAYWMLNAINSLVVNLSAKEKESFVNQLFDELAKNGEKTIFDFKKDPLKILERILIKTYHISKKNKNTSRKVALSLFFGTDINDLKNINKVSDFFFSNIFYGIVMILFGILFVVIPRSALYVAAMTLLTLFIGFELALSLYYLIKSKWNFRLYKLRLSFLAFTIAIYIAIWIKEGNIAFFANWLFALFFLLFGIWMIQSLEKNRKKSIFDFIWNILEILFYIVIGCYLLYAPEQFLSYGTFVTGFILIVDGGIKIIR